MTRLLVWLAPLALSACLEAVPGTHGSANTGAATDEPWAAPLPAALQAGRPAAALLATLVVRPQEPHSGYGREQFGPAWADADRNGCDTRNDILKRDLDGARFEPTSRRCVVLAGTLADPYTGASIRFERGGGAQVDIDHVVALGNAWATGAAHWPFHKRIALANDPLNLVAAQAAANRAKGDADAAAWLPPDRAHHCAYVARQISVKAKYALWVTPAEHDAMAAVLRACPDEPALTGDAPILAPIDPPEPAPHEPASKPAGARRSAATKYASCADARAHHAGPYVRGRDPEYAYYHDGDGDGVACE